MKQTAVEFLVEKIKPLYIGNFEMTFLKEIEQAKEMEKQQIIDARVKKPLETEYVEAKQYYNETFNK
jgi:hypothetical protein